MEEDRLIAEVKQGRTALRWAYLALAFSILGVLGEFTFIYLVLTHSQYIAACLLFSLGSIIISFYCRKMGELSKPESWR